jgi:hypothetical protein
MFPERHVLWRRCGTYMFQDVAGMFDGSTGSSSVRGWQVTRVHSVKNE